MKPAEIALQQTRSEPVAQRSRCSSRQRRRKAKKLFVVPGFRPLDRGTAGVRGVRKRHDFMFLFESQSSRQRNTQSISQHLQFSPISGHLRSLIVCSPRACVISAAPTALFEPVAAPAEVNTLARAAPERPRVQCVEKTHEFGPDRFRDLTPEPGIQYPKEVRGFGRGTMGMTDANIAFAQSPPGIGRKRPSLPGQLPGDRASAVPLQLPQMRPVR